MLISNAAKTDVKHAAEVSKIHESFFEAKARMIDERVAETQAHDIAIKSKDLEAEARDAKYLADL